MRSEPWPIEREAQLREFLAAGMSASQASRALIADGFQASRNAVIGKAHRISAKLPGATPPRRWTPEADAILREHWETNAASVIVQMLSAIGFHVTPNGVRARVTKTTRFRKGKGAPGRRRNVTSRSPRIYEPPPTPPDARMIGLMDLGPHDCSFPIGDPKQPGFGYCGAPKMVVGSYCRYHRHLAYQPNSAMRVSQQKGLVRYDISRAFVSGMAL